MDPSEHDEKDLRAATRRRRIVVGLLATAAIAIPGIALASVGGGTTGSAQPAPAADEDVPSIWTQDGSSEGRDGRHDGRKCRRKDRDGGSDTSFQQRDL